jgi:signal transduction histidine kinase
MLHPGVDDRPPTLHPPADDAFAGAAYRSLQLMLAIYRWLTRSGFDPDERTAPAEVIVLRSFGLAYLALFVVEIFTTRPYPALHGRGAVVLAAMIVFVVAVVATQPQRADIPVWGRVAALGGVTVAAATLAAIQPSGFWPAGAYYIGVVAALRLQRLAGVLTLGLSLVVLVSVSAIAGHNGELLSVPLGVVPWFLVIRLMALVRDQHAALRSSQAAEARAAVAAERGWLVREMHDVLAHSLSALALQLESTRLLARDRGVDDDVTRAVDQAHHLAASGLQDARRAIAAIRGDQLLGPERIGVLADTFGEQSGVPVAVEIEGEPRELAPDARLAMYRTAQEALTNVRRHATPERVEVKLAYLAQSTVLVVEDHAGAGAPPSVAVGLTGGGYGLTGMRERAELLGGELLAVPTAKGFRVELRLPA